MCKGMRLPGCLLAFVFPAFAQTPLSLFTTSDVWRFAIGRTQDGYIVRALGGKETPQFSQVCYSFTSTGSVPGLSFAQTGGSCSFSYRLAGTPTTPGTYPVSVTVNDGQGTAPATRNFQVIVFPRLEIVTQTLPEAEEGAPYSFQIEYRGGWTPYTEIRCSLTFPGLTCDNTGRISGRPGGPGFFQGAVDFFISDGFQNNTVRRLFDLNVRPGLRIVDTALPAGTVGTAYSRQLTASGGRSPYQFAAASGLPGGLSLSSSGVLSGTPTTAGTFQIQVRATDANGTVAGTTLSLVVAPRGALRIVSTSLPEACIGQPYTAQLTATGNEGPVRWGAVNLPPGLSINPATGVISGTPTGPAGERVVGIGAATDTQSANVDLRLNVKDCSQPGPNPTPGPTPALRIANTSFPEACVGQPYTAQLTVTGADGGVSLAVENLPAGLSFNPVTGVISGTPSGGLGDLNVSITAVTDTQSANLVLKLTVKACPAPMPTLRITNTSLPEACVGQTYSAQLAAQGNEGQVQWSATNLPPNLLMNLAGAISGVVAAGTAGVRAVAVTATTLTQTASATLQLTVRNCTEPAPPTPLQAPKGFVGESYLWPFTAPGDVTPVEIPNWLRYDSATRTFRGTPTQEGRFPVTLTRRTSPFATVTEVYEIVVERPTVVVVNPGSPFVLRAEGITEQEGDVLLNVTGPPGGKVNVTTSGPLEYKAEQIVVPTIVKLFPKDNYVGFNSGNIGIGATQIPYTLIIPRPSSGWTVNIPNHFNTSTDRFVFFDYRPPPGHVLPDPDFSQRAILVETDAPPSLLRMGSAGASFNATGVAPGTYSYTVDLSAVDERTGTTSSTYRFSFTVTVPFAPGQFIPTGIDPLESIQRNAPVVSLFGTTPGANVTVNGLTVQLIDLADGTKGVVLPRLPTGEVKIVTATDERTVTVKLVDDENPPIKFLEDHAIGVSDLGIYMANTTSDPFGTTVYGENGFNQALFLNPGLNTITGLNLPEGMVCITGRGAVQQAPNTPGGTGQSCMAYADHRVVVPAQKEIPGQRPADACTPTRLIPLFTRPAPMASVKAGVPEFLRVWVYDNCGVPRTDAAVNLAFRNGDAPVALTHTGRGRYSAMWTPQRSTDAFVSVVASVAAGAFTARKSNLVSVAANPAVAIFDQRSIVSGASFEASRPRAPGEFVSIFGSNLAPRSESARTLPLPTTLGGVSLTFNGRPVPLLFVSPAQINLILPYGVPVHQFLEFYLIRDNVESGPIRVPVAAAQPAIFSRDLTGKGQGIILDPQFRFYDAANPAAVGNAFVIYLSGLGEVTPAVEAGSPAPTTSLHRVRLPVRVTIGGVAVTDIAFAGLAPGLTGVYQLNGVVPAGVQPGNTVPVVVTVDGMSSPAVTMAVR